MHFQLWFPGQSRDAAGVLKANGLGDFAEGCRESVVKLDVNGLPGLLIGWSGDSGVIPERQQVIDCGAYSLLLWTDSPCRPEELKRQSMFGAYLHTLADGNQWQVPQAAELPATFRLVDQAWSKIRKPQFDEFWRQSELWYRRFLLCDLDADKICQAENLTVEQLQGQFASFCVFALRQNYRVTPEVVSELGLLDTDAVFRIIFSVLDGLHIQEVQDELRQRDDIEAAFEKKEATGSLIPV